MNWLSKIPGSTFSLFENRKVIKGEIGNEDIYWLFSAFMDDDNAYQTVGCCKLQLVAEESIIRNYNRFFGPAKIESHWAFGRGVDSKFDDLKSELPEAY